MLKLSNDQKEVADELMASALGFGWLLVQASGIGSAAMGETSMGIDWRTGKKNIHVLGDNGKAHGLFQIWDVEGVKRGCGVDITTASVKDQVRALDWMLRHGDPADRNAGAMLLKATTPEAAALAMVEFERPADRIQARAKRVPWADDLYEMYMSLTPVASFAPPTPPQKVATKQG